MTELSLRMQNTLHIEAFRDWQRTRSLSPQSITQYHATLTAWVAWIGKRDVRRVDGTMVTEFSLRPRRGRAHGNVGSAATRRKDVVVLSAFYQWLQASDPLVANPTLLCPRPKVKNSKPKALADATWLQLYAAADDAERVWLGLGFFAGLRRMEICNLTPAQFNLDAGLIVNFTRKGGSEDHFPLTEVLQVWAARQPTLLVDDNLFLEPLAKLVATRERAESLIPWRGGYLIRHSAVATERYGPEALIEPTAMSSALDRLVKRANVKEEVTPHSLRHSFVSNMLRMGVPIQIVSSLASHTSVAVTARYMSGSRRMLAEWRATPDGV
jgi:integrase/recombinase XerD